MQSLAWWWLNHVQKSMATVLALLSVVDLSGNADTIEAFAGKKGYAGIRLACALAIAYRAVQHTRTGDGK